MRCFSNAAQYLAAPCRWGWWTHSRCRPTGERFGIAQEGSAARPRAYCRWRLRRLPQMCHNRTFQPAGKRRSETPSERANGEASPVEYGQYSAPCKPSTAYPDSITPCDAHVPRSPPCDDDAAHSSLSVPGCGAQGHRNQRDPPVGSEPSHQCRPPESWPLAPRTPPLEKAMRRRPATSGTLPPLGAATLSFNKK